MIRLVGAVLVAAGCAWGGFRAADGLRGRVRALEEMGRGLALLEQELELDSPPLPQLMDRLVPRCRGPARELFLRLAPSGGGAGGAGAGGPELPAPPGGHPGAVRE